MVLWAAVHSGGRAFVVLRDQTLCRGEWGWQVPGSCRFSGDQKWGGAWQRLRPEPRPCDTWWEVAGCSERGPCRCGPLEPSPTLRRVSFSGARRAEPSKPLVPENDSLLFTDPEQLRNLRLCFI